MTSEVLPDPGSVAYPVAMQLEAYNARAIDAFMAWWTEDCEIFAFPDTLLARGTTAIRARHIERFAEPDLHAKLVGRIVVGDVVIDQETVQRNFADGRGEVDVTCIYEVRDGRIARAWFRMGAPRLHHPAS